jgi:hypothetical protein
MRKLNIYTFHRGIADHRFDAHNTSELKNILKTSYDINHHDMNGDDKFIYTNDCNVLIDQGSILIFEFDDTKQFKVFDFGDSPSITLKLSKSKNFIGASIGQYNKKLWDLNILDSEKRNSIKPSVYPESCWNFGLVNFEEISEYRNKIKLDDRLYWRGSIYNTTPDPNYRNTRMAIEHLSVKMDNFYFAPFPIMFDDYISESINFKLALCFGGGGGYSCGDLCFRDIEMYGLGIPTLRPKFAIETDDPLIPNEHYISVDCKFDNTYRYTENETLAENIIKRYYEVINDGDYLKYIASNAREWYIRNATGPNITNKIVETLGI